MKSEPISDIENRFQGLVPAGANHSLWLFFLAFSRFECALKSAGFVKPVRTRAGDEYLRVEWKRFASEHKDDFNPDLNTQLRDACDYFKSKPPKRRFFAQRSWIWTTPTLRR
jgi:hypothetical protein